MEHTTRGLVAWAVYAALLVLSGCGGDLGKCDMVVLGGSLLPGMEAPNQGQLIMHASCAGGRCHSESAVGAARVGAPAGLDFDVVPSVIPQDQALVVRGEAVVRENAEEIWEEVNEGVMPPPAPAGAGRELSSADKEALRNWLACGSPVIAAVPAIDTSDPWLSLYDLLMGPRGTCSACHSVAGGPGAGGGFTLGDDACSAYARVLNGAASGAECGGSGALLVVPFDPAASLLSQKLGAAPSCGALMPFGTTTPYVQTNPQLVADLDAWIRSGAPKPAICP